MDRSFIAQKEDLNHIYPVTPLMKPDKYLKLYFANVPESVV